MGKGSSSAPAAQQVVSTGLPDYVDPYFKRLLKGAEEATMPFDPETGESTYTPYTGERLTRSADYADITGARQNIRDIAGSGLTGLNEALAAQRSGIAGLTSLAGAPPSFTASNFSATGVDPYSGFKAGTADPYSDFSQAQFSKAQGT